MRKYRSHKIVEAAKIAGFRHGVAGDLAAVITDTGERVEVPAGFASRTAPKSGDYVVRYSDGYLSHSPADTFEQGYTEINAASGPALSLDQAKAVVDAKTAPRVTKDAIEAAIADVDYLRHDTLTLCIITMRNGFKAVGKAAPADPANFDYQVGCRFAYEDAFKQLWPLMGFALCERLYNETTWREAGNSALAHKESIADAAQ